MHDAGARVVYEVNLDVEVAIAGEFRAWLDAHVREILALPGFLGVRVCEVRDPPPADDRLHLCVQYTLRDAAALDAYLRDHAPRMRAQGLARFDGHFTAQRRVMGLAMELGRA
ncbi:MULTISPECIES: DUF4286 family protein [unclassified Lysobacter]|uniref:DUF4286 family protein n=1 Tax=unclassified Lysobacter TaxID=2635362 RepID=UPI001C214909|nr:DUF4286 family protein [Lysobacter sp. MMG2]MBU8976938.1 DUF4286 family protein [Lysobacter sp. MMG2]